MRAIGDPHLASPDQVQLAHEPAFVLGSLTVTPATRQVARGTEHETLEPRVMQVLVALAHAPDRILTRDELVECCWSGRAVSEDAIHRVLSRLRHVAAGIGGGSFAVETIRGVGYRLVEDGAGEPWEAGTGLARSSAPLSRRSILVGSAAAAAAAGAGAWLIFRRGHDPLPLALQYYRRGLETRGQGSLQLAEQGTALFREAARIDPEFADAWGALAWNYRGLLEFGPRPDTARLRALSRSAAARALEIDPDNVEAQAALLLLRPFYGNWLEIERGLRALLKQHPDNSIVEYNLAYTLYEVGRVTDAIPHMERVSERERFWPIAHVEHMRGRYAAGQFQEAEDLVEEGMKRFPRRTEYWASRVRHLLIAGRIPEALAFAADLAQRPTQIVDPIVDLELAIARALANGSEQARAAALQKIEQTVRSVRALQEFGVGAAAVLGFVDQAFSMAEGYFFGRGAWAPMQPERRRSGFLFGPSTGPLRRDKRFAGLMEETGIAEYWRRTRTLPDYLRQG